MKGHLEDNGKYVYAFILWIYFKRHTYTNKRGNF